jgi:hypothetical protein
MSKSSVPWSRSVDGGKFPSTFNKRMKFSPVDCQGSSDVEISTSGAFAIPLPVESRYSVSPTALPAELRASTAQIVGAEALDADLLR